MLPGSYCPYKILGLGLSYIHSIGKHTESPGPIVLLVCIIIVIINNCNVFQPHTHIKMFFIGLVILMVLSWMGLRYNCTHGEGQGGLGDIGREHPDLDDAEDASGYEADDEQEEEDTQDML